MHKRSRNPLLHGSSKGHKPFALSARASRPPVLTAKTAKRPAGGARSGAAAVRLGNAGRSAAAPTPTLFASSKQKLLANVRKLKNPREFTFVVMGDSWAGNGQTSNDIFGLALQAIRNLKRKPLFVLHSGDSVFTGAVQEFKTGGTYSGVPVKSLLQLIKDPQKGIPELPFFIVPGNHDQTGINGPLTNFRKIIGPTRFSLNLPRIKTSIIGLNNIAQLGPKSGPIIYGFPKGELDFLRNKLRDAQKNAIVFMHVPPRIGRWANKNYFQDPTSTFGNTNNQLIRFLNIIHGIVPNVYAGHVHAFSQQRFRGTHYVISGGAGAPLVKEGFLKRTRTPVFHILELTVRNGVVVRQRFIPIGFTA